MKYLTVRAAGLEEQENEHGSFRISIYSFFVYNSHFSKRFLHKLVKNKHISNSEAIEFDMIENGRVCMIGEKAMA